MPMYANVDERLHQLVVDAAEDAGTSMRAMLEAIITKAAMDEDHGPREALRRAYLKVQLENEQARLVGEIS